MTTYQTLDTLLRHLIGYRGPFHAGYASNDVIDGRGCRIAYARELAPSPQAAIKAIEPYIYSVCIFDGRFKVCL